MIPFDIVVSFVAGQMLALSARKQLKKEPSIFFNVYLFIAALWMAILYAPSAMFFFHNWTDWNVMYIVPPEKLPSYVIWLDCSALFLVLLFGFISAHILIRRGNDKLIVVSSIAAVVALLAFMWITFDRSFFVGSYEEWKAGTATWLFSSPVWTANIYSGVIDLVPLGYLCYRFLKEGDRR